MIILLTNVAILLIVILVLWLLPKMVERYITLCLGIVAMIKSPKAAPEASNKSNFPVHGKPLN